MASGEALTAQPREDGALPAPARLRHPVHWFLYSTDASGGYLLPRALS